MLSRYQISALRDNTKSLISTAFAHYINDGSLNIVTILYPILVLPPYNFSNTMVGVTAAVLNGFSIIMSPFIGRRSDLGRNYANLIIIGLGTISLGIIGFALAMVYFHGLELFFVLIPFALVAGFGSSFYHPIGAAILNEQWERKNRGRAMGINGSMGSFGILSFPIIAVALIATFGIASMGLLGLLGFAIAVMIHLLMRRVKFKPKETDIIEESGKNFHASQSNNKSPIPFAIIIPTILALTISTFIRSFSSQSVIQFLPLYLNTVDKIPYSYVAIAVAVMPAMGMVSQPLFGYLADRFGRRLNLGLSTAGAIVAMLVFISTTNIVVAEVALAFFGLFQFTGFPLILALAIEISPKGATTISNSIVWGIGNIGGATIGPVVLGLLSEPGYLGSLNSAFFAMTTVGLISLVFVPFIPRPVRND